MQKLSDLLLLVYAISGIIWGIFITGVIVKKRSHTKIDVMGYRLGFFISPVVVVLVFGLYIINLIKSKVLHKPIKKASVQDEINQIITQNKP